MAENIIYCYSGGGNCLDMAKNIARELGDTDIVMMRSAPVKTDAREAKRVGFIFPCHGGGLPGKVEEYAKTILISPDAYTFGIVQYAGYMGCGLYKLDRIRELDYWAGMSHQCTCIWLMPHGLMNPPLSVAAAQKRSEAKARAVAADIKAMKHSAKRPPRRAACILESAGFSKVVGKKAAQYTVNDRCIGCGTCVSVCPRHNIRLEGGRPVFGGDCIGCLSCIQYCPAEALNVGKVTEKRERYHNPNVSAQDLCAELIHID